MLVVGVVAGVIAPGGGHELAMTNGYYTELPSAVRRNLRVTLVDELPRIIQRHDIEGFMMG